ncbi:MAG: hypothetical protein CL610_29555 [Anaerolineaceae bacterium]|nr:hypothetical protein [Anaerolineaceae bacterium]
MRTALENFAAELLLPHVTADDLAQLDSIINQQEDAIRRKDFNNVRSLDMAFHRYLVHNNNNQLLTRNWEEIVAQIAALLYMRADAMPDYDEMLAVRDHRAILDGYRAHNLTAVHEANRRINNRVAGECKRALAINNY